MTARTVYLVDDHDDFRESTRFWLQACGFETAGWADPRQALQAVAMRDGSADACLMLDVRMPELSGLDVHDRLLAGDDPLPVIYMSGHADVPMAVRAMQKGAVTLLEKPFDDDSLEAALDAAFARAAQLRQARRVAADEEAGPPDGGCAATARRAPPADTADPADDEREARRRFAAREASLSPRERQVLGQVIEGTYNKVIADRLDLSVKTVELYRARGMAKMKARSVAELTRMMVSRKA